MSASILSTIQQAERTLLQQANMLTADAYFELGDDPDVVEELVTQLEGLLTHIKIDLGGIYALPQKELDVANLYYSVIGDLNHAVELLKNIRRLGNGSTENTESILELLNQCLKHIHALAEEAGLKILPHELGLERLQEHLACLKPDHPARERFNGLKAELQEAWLRNNDKDTIERVLSDLDDLSLSLTSLRFQELESLDASDDGNFIIPTLKSIVPISRCWAILVGVSSHVDPAYGQLPHAANDAHAMAKVLLLSGAQGYAPDRAQVFLSAQDVTCNDSGFKNNEPQFRPIYESIVKTAQQAGPDDLLLFYFSGHGLLYNGIPYLICQDTSELSISHTALQMSELKRYVQNSEARVKVIILDTCHAGAILGTAKDVDPMQEDYSRMVGAGSAGTVIMMSCRPGERSFPLEDNQMSVFTHYLVEGIQKAGLQSQAFVTAHDLSAYVSQGVKQWVLHSPSGRIQTPQYWYNLDGGDPIIIDWGTEEIAQVFPG
jgi:hypothetical protein